MLLTSVHDVHPPPLGHLEQGHHKGDLVPGRVTGGVRAGVGDAEPVAVDAGVGDAVEEGKAVEGEGAGVGMRRCASAKILGGKDAGSGHSIAVSRTLKRFTIKCELGMLRVDAWEFGDLDHGDHDVYICVTG